MAIALNLPWTIQEHLPADAAEQWNRYQQEKGHVFNTSWFAENCRTIGYQPHYALIKKGDSWEAASVFFSKRVGPALCRWNWATFFGEPSYDDSLSADQRTLLFSQLLKQISAFGPAFISTSGSMARFSLEELTMPGLDQIPFGTFEIDLSASEESLWDRVHSKHRNAVRSAAKLGVEVTEQENWDGFYQLLESTLARAGEACPSESYVCGTGRVLKSQGCAKLYTATYQGNLQAAALILCTRARAYYWFGATAQPSVTGAGNLLQWTIIQKFKAEGIRIYDFGGARPHLPENSRLLGIQRFKERFGGAYQEAPQWKWVCSSPRTLVLQNLQKAKRLIFR